MRKQIRDFHPFTSTSSERVIEFSKEFDLDFIVSEDVYFAFQRVSKDFNPLHTDINFAKSKGYQDKVMYGNILNAFVSYFVGMGLPDRNVIIQSQDIAYHEPVYLNDRLVLKTKMENYSEATQTIVYKLRFERIESNKNTLVAKGHVQIGLLQ